MGYEHNNGLDVCDFGYCDEGMSGRLRLPPRVATRGATAATPRRSRFPAKLEIIMQLGPPTWGVSRSPYDGVSIHGGRVHASYNAVTLPKVLSLPPGDYTIRPSRAGIGAMSYGKHVKVTLRPGQRKTVTVHIPGRG
jgi:hypothetical protein